jgi:hypothetical protein
MTLRTGTIVVVVAATFAAAAADIAGTWQAEVRGPGGAIAVEALDLTVKTDVVTGTLKNAVGGVSQLRDGTWDGTTLRFWVPWDPGKLEAVGKPVGTTLQLQFKTSQWTATRIFKRVPQKE